MTKKIWKCSCGMYWWDSEQDARSHAKEAKHEITELEVTDKEWEAYKTLTRLV